MADVFKNTELQYGGGFRGNFGLLSSAGGILTGALMQSIQLSYQQRVNQLYEVGTAGTIGNVYYMQGRAAGQLNAARILGPGVAMQTFYDKFSDVCEARSNVTTVNLEAGVCTNNLLPTDKAAYKAKFCILVQVALGAQAQDLLINESVNLMFGNLER